MQINSDSLNALGVFDVESHAYQHAGRSKEGLSLFGILNTARTPEGKALLRSWMLRPLLVLDDIISRHDLVGLLARRVPLPLPVAKLCSDV